jgi:hypothetical protein
MPLTSLIAVGSSNTRRQKTIKAKAALVGSYVPVTGVPLDLTTMTDPTFQGSCFPGMVPTTIQIDNSPAGYSGEIIAGTGTTLATAYALKIYTAPGVEMTAIAFPAALLADSFLLAMTGPNWGF